MNSKFPSNISIVIIGGGVIGTSIAYHLCQFGEVDVVVLEKTKLTEGATWHAAGLVGQFRSQQNLTSIMVDSVKLFDKIAEQTGQETGWRKVGSLRIATCENRWKELLRSYSMAQAIGLEMNMLTPSEIATLYPLLETSELVGAAFIPEDGYIDPHSLTLAYAKGIKSYGGRIIEETMVQELILEGRRIKEVITNQGNIKADIVVNAAGLWARQIGWMAGVEIPAGIVEHQYLVTEKSEKIPNNIPVLRDPDGSYYVKPEPRALVIGGWENDTNAVNPINGFPWNCARHLFENNMDRLEEIMKPATKRLPILNNLGLRNIINGPIPISPDGEPIMGLVPNLENFYTACAFTSGIAASGGAGKAMANWIIHGDPGLDLWAFDIRRFGSLHAGARFLHTRAIESYSNYYAMHFPGKEYKSARGIKRSPLYDALKKNGAVFGSKFGWERANWFSRSDIPPVNELNFEYSRQNGAVEREHISARENVVIIDQTSFTKFEISGRNACDLMQFLAVSNVAKPSGGALYTQLCNAKGGIEADITVIRRDRNTFWVITGSANNTRDWQWITRKVDQFDDVEVRDITSAYGVINICGPNSRTVLEQVCDEDVSHESFPFMTVKDIRVGFAPVCAYRVTYIGELGWELYVPMEYMQHVYDVLRSAGSTIGIIDIGYQAIDSLRLEKNYRVWGSDITPDNNPIEAGLQFCVDLRKENFIGRAALEKIVNTGVTKKLTCLALNDPLPVFGGEAIFLNGEAISQSTSGNFGYSVGKSIILAYLSVDTLNETEFEVESLGMRSKAVILKDCAYDPERKKILC